jgi:hypothetical protein
MNMIRIDVANIDFFSVALEACLSLLRTTKRKAPATLPLAISPKIAA